MKKILYITYDGLTDPLGQSQILPYLKGLSVYGYKFTILSFEKKDRYKKEKDHIETLTNESGIQWVPLTFTKNPPLFSKFYDALRMRKKAFQLHNQIGFDMVHCRSYIAADVGLALKRKGVKFLFDMRGFWADEKKDGGSWDMNNPVFRSVYRYYKSKEKNYLREADAVISLTDAARKEMTTWDFLPANISINVIPCCADMNLFSLTDEAQKNQSRQKLSIDPRAFVLSYLGSIGTWYMLDEMLLFFQYVKKKFPSAIFLFITQHPPSEIYDAAAKYKLSKTDLIIKSARRNEVPALVKASDVNISFIKPVYSKISSSPTKLGEVLSMGIPVICNSGIGDVKNIVEEARAGLVLDGFTEKDFMETIDQIPALLQLHPGEIRKNIQNIYSLENGIELYRECYNSIFNEERKKAVSYLSVS